MLIPIEKSNTKSIEYDQINNSILKKNKTTSKEKIKKRDRNFQRK